MPRTKTKKPQRKPSAKPAIPPAAPSTNANEDVLTLAEAAAYLRVKEDDVMRMVGSGDFPGRLLGGEWRFLKSSLRDWLRTPAQPSSKEALRSIIGSWKDDPYLDEMLQEIYRQRGRPMLEEDE